MTFTAIAYRPTAPATCQGREMQGTVAARALTAARVSAVAVSLAVTRPNLIAVVVET